jgi:hypothetical protein
MTLSTDHIENVIDDDLIISNYTGALKFSSNKIISSIHIYDILGRSLIDVKPGSKLFELKTASLKPGTILLIKATLANRSVINKKTILY